MSRRQRNGKPNKSGKDTISAIKPGAQANSKTTGRKFEINVPDKDVNKSDLKVLFGKMGDENDYTWYTVNEQMAKDAASLPFGQPLGTSVKWNLNEKQFATSPDSVPNIPGIFTLDLTLVPGKSEDWNSPINVAAQQLYTVDRQANSGATNYDKTDLMFMVYAMDNAYALYAELVRAYRTLSLYDYLNRYLPDALLYTAGFDPENLRRNAADFRLIINQYAYRLASINVPDQITILKRHAWLFSNYYTDSDGPKAQIYMYRPSGYFVWTEGTSDNPTQLEWQSRGVLSGAQNNQLTVDNIATLCDALVTPLLGSEDVGTISGDLAKAFGANNMVKLATVVENESINPVYSMEVVEQMMNATILNHQLSTNVITQKLDNTQMGPYIYYNPYITYQSGAINGLPANIGNILNVRGSEPDYKQVLVATRLMVSMGEMSGANNDVQLESFGTELCVDAAMWTLQPSTSGSQITSMPFVQRAIIAPAAAGGGITAINLIKQMVVASKFDNHPTMYVFNLGNNSQPEYIGFVQDADTFTMISNDTINTINE